MAVIVPGSELRPHFAGPSYVRVGSETLEASDQQYDGLVASRNGKTRTILAFKGKAVVVINRLRLATEVREGNWSYDPIIEDCNQWWVTLKQLPGGALSTFPLDDVTLSFETSKKTLLIYLAR